MLVEIEGIEIELERNDGVVTVDMRAVRDGRTHRLALGHLDPDQDGLSIAVSAAELRGAGLAADA